MAFDRCFLVAAGLGRADWSAIKHAFGFVSSPAEEVMDGAITSFHDDLIERYRSGVTTGRRACGELAAWIAGHMKPVPRLHEALINKTMAWLGTSLNPEVESLHTELPYSGDSLSGWLQAILALRPPLWRERCVQSGRLTCCLSPKLSDEGEAEIAAAFYDQPHMIREIRHYLRLYAQLAWVETPNLCFQTNVADAQSQQVEIFPRYWP